LHPTDEAHATSQATTPRDDVATGRASRIHFARRRRVRSCTRFAERSCAFDTVREPHGDGLAPRVSVLTP
jgi:hypothetical protein